MDRRNFLKTGGIALLGSLTTGSAMALATPGALGGEGADKKATVALAMNHFGVSEADLKKVPRRSIGERRRLRRSFL